MCSTRFDPVGAVPVSKADFGPQELDFTLPDGPQVPGIQAVFTRFLAPSDDPN
jgi:hypothetical protein